MGRFWIVCFVCFELFLASTVCSGEVRLLRLAIQTNSKLVQANESIQVTVCLQGGDSQKVKYDKALRTTFGWDETSSLPISLTLAPPNVNNSSVTLVYTNNFDELRTLLMQLQLQIQLDK